VNFYKRYIGDYQRDTNHLTLVEHGVYTVLLDHYYARRGPLPGDLAALYRLCRATTRVEKRAVQSVADQFFPEQIDGTRTNDRATREIAKWETQSEHNRQIAPLGGMARHKANKNKEGVSPRDCPEGSPESARTLPAQQPECSPEPCPDSALSRIQKPDFNSVPLTGSLHVGNGALTAIARKSSKHKNGVNGAAEPEETRLGKALQVLKADPTFPLDKLATMFQLSLSQLREATA